MSGLIFRLSLRAWNSLFRRTAARPGKSIGFVSFPDKNGYSKQRMIALPRLYPILDAGFFPDANALFAAAEELAAGGATLIQYRNKSGNARVMLEQARELRRLVPHPNVARTATLGLGTQDSVRLIMNDRADLALAAEFDG